MDFNWNFVVELYIDQPPLVSTVYFSSSIKTIHLFAAMICFEKRKTVFFCKNFKSPLNYLQKIDDMLVPPRIQTNFRCINFLVRFLLKTPF